MSKKAKTYSRKVLTIGQVRAQVQAMIKASGESQAGWARKAGVSPITLNAMLVGHRGLSAKMQKRLRVQREIVYRPY